MPPVITEDEKQAQIDRGDYVEDDDYEELEEDDEKEEESEDEEDKEEDEGEDESEEEEDSEEDDSEVDSEEDEGDEGSESDQRVPISRLNRVIAQREREKERTEWLEDQLERLLEVQLADKSSKQKEAPKSIPEFNFEEAETNYADLLIEGEPAKAAKLRAEIDLKREEKFANVLTSFKEELSSVVEQKATTSVDEDRFNTLVENFENKHTFLDIESDDYNEEAVETVNTLMAGFLATDNISKSQAIKKAVNKVAPMYEKPVASKKDSTKRTKDGRKRNVDAMKKTPAKINGKKRANRDVSDFNVETMSDKDFSKLTAREKAELRGDIVG